MANTGLIDDGCMWLHVYQVIYGYGYIQAYMFFTLGPAYMGLGMNATKVT